MALSNELIFGGHILAVIVAILIALRLGKEALTALFCLLIISANLFVIKQIEFLGMTITCTEAMTIGCILSLNLIQEYWGKKQAKKAIYCSFFLLICFGVLAQFQMLYLPSPHDTHHGIYNAVLRYSPRLLLASLFTTLIVLRFDMALYGFFKRKMRTQSLLMRNIASLAISQLLDTALFSVLGLAGIVHSIVSIMIVSYFVKVVVILSMTPFTLVSKKVVRRHAV